MDYGHWVQFARALLPVSVFAITAAFVLILITFTIRALYLNRNKTKLNSDNFPRMSLGLVIVCASWIVLSLPKFVTSVQNVYIEATVEGGFTLETFRGSELVSTHRIRRSIVKYTWYSYGFVNVLILLVVVKQLREPAGRVLGTLKNNLGCVRAQ